MRNLASTRIVFTPVRRPWYRQLNWGVLGILLSCAGLWAFIIWLAAKAVR